MCNEIDVKALNWKSDESCHELMSMLCRKFQIALSLSLSIPSTRLIFTHFNNQNTKETYT